MPAIEDNMTFHWSSFILPDGIFFTPNSILQIPHSKFFCFSRDTQTASRNQILSEIHTYRQRLRGELSTLPFDGRIACLAHVTATRSNALSYEISNKKLTNLFSNLPFGSSIKAPSLYRRSRCWITRRTGGRIRMKPWKITRVSWFIVIGSHFTIANSINRFMRFRSAANVNKIHKSGSSTFSAAFW